MWLMNGVGISNFSSLLTDVNWRVVGIGDFNGDNRDDLLCHDVTSGALVTDLAPSEQGMAE